MVHAGHRPKREVYDSRAYSLKEHESVMFSQCPRCEGRVMWGGDGDTRWLNITGIRGACLLCPFEVYTMDLLKDARDQEEADRIRRALEAA